ncbi:hypothetical protein [Geobacter sp. SVR]|uniref:hypothetical protein n=1 Tax=Geobacter sp. SVR TaxID=2495594 RepID=UPI00143F03BA|nr:hypothetical protein [Geobacter sp. SVR]BCS56026.1 hypothetical protein GSVR_43340 [Geobacter sp. SVR]GCF84789.1 hypothetical protein GSbR_13890 [Geobacter sp. SVR]
MKSTSRLCITWVRPELEGEHWEFFHHPAKQDFYRRNGIAWDNLVCVFENGRLEPYPRDGHLGGVTVELSYHRYEDYSRFLARSKRGYRLPYTRMETALQQEGHLTLPAPIILQCSDRALLFSGYRRLCLAWNYGMVPAVWLVTVASL